MASLSELAASIEANRVAIAEVGGPISSSKGQADSAEAAMRAVGVEGAADRMHRAGEVIEEAQALRAGLEGALVKAHFIVLSAIHGKMGPSAPGSGAIVPLKLIDPKTGAPDAGLDAIPPHLRHDPKPTGDELTGIDPTIGPFQKEHENANADAGKSKPKRFGRSAIKNADELAGQMKQASGQLTFKLEDDFDPWGSDAEAIAEVPTAPPPVFFSRVDAEGIKAGDLLSSTIVVAAFAFEALTRLSRKKEDG